MNDMTPEMSFVELVRHAQRGDRESIERLTAMARQRVAPYIYRLTLDHDLTGDLLQETLLKMIEALKNIRQPESFWPWLFRTALGVVQHHYRDQAKQQQVEFSALSLRRLKQYLDGDHEDGLNRLMRQELSEAVLAAVAQLRLSHRSVLMLRCYEQMSYAEIASLMDCKELRARILFYRARHALSRQLKRRGFGKGLLLTALGLFEILTAPADSAAAATVSASSLHVGLAGTLAGAAGTPPGIALVATAAGLGLSLTLEHFIYTALFAGFVLVSFIVALYWD
ncbi:MAG: RNA polymerase sigma factor [Sedimentisphaerales bacterium]|nr:RNA polymerase sigma factor [Sedimentisphaerales bacterium]